MKGVRFYEEFASKRRGVSAGNCVAVFTEDDGRLMFNFPGSRSVSGIGGVFEHPNSPPASTSVSVDYLAERCKRVSEARAREVHPELFKWLDD